MKGLPSQAMGSVLYPEGVHGSSLPDLQAVACGG